jgi:GTP-binding protein YchF
MKLGISGASKSGKTTIFNAITGREAEISMFEVKIEPNISIVNVEDERINHLTELYNPKKTIYANIEIIDFPGMTSGNDDHEFLSSSSMTLLKTTDAIAIVLRNFNSDVLDETLGVPDPVKDITKIFEEYILADLVIAENRLTKIELSYKRGQKTAALEIEEKAIRKAIESLSNEKPLRLVEFVEEELKSIKGYQFLSLKPVMIILNSDENNFGKNEVIIDGINVATNKTVPVHEFAGNFEMELVKLEDSEKIDFMNDIGITQSATNRVIQAAYTLLGYLSFFTVGSDEVRAWTITNGDNAVTAAGKIHSDLARGFIRAETFNYKDIIEHKNENTIREKGLFRLEGKNYQVKDGDILNIRFNV